MELIGTLAGAAVFFLMMTIGISNPVRDLMSDLTDRALLLRSLISVVVVVPIIIMVLMLLVDLPPGVQSGLVLLAACIGAPMTTKRAAAAGSDMVFVASLQLTLASLAVVVAPLVLSVFYGLFDLLIERMSPTVAASQIARVALFPLMVGVALRAFTPDFASKIETWVARIGDILFLLMIVVLIGFLVFASEFRQVFLIGWPATLLIAVVVIAAITSGHVLGGPEHGRRAALAIATVARNIGLALYLAGQSDNTDAIAPTILVFMLTGSVLAGIYSAFVKRQLSS